MHSTTRHLINNLGNTPFGMGTFPTEITGESATVNGVTAAQAITAAEYNSWAAFNNKPLATSTATGVTGTPEGNTLLASIRSTVNAVRLPPSAGRTSGALPDAFFHIQLPQGFATSNSLSYDITTLQASSFTGYVRHMMANFGTLTNAASSNARYIQFGIRLIF